jgi:hypothetical protein
MRVHVVCWSLWVELPVGGRRSSSPRSQPSARWRQRRRRPAPPRRCKYRASQAWGRPARTGSCTALVSGSAFRRSICDSSLTLPSMWSLWHQPRGNVCVLGPWFHSRWVAPAAQPPAPPSRSRCRAIGFRRSSDACFRAPIGGSLTSSCTTSFISNALSPGMPPACSTTTASRDRSPPAAASSPSDAAPAAAMAPGAHSDRRLLLFGPRRERIAASTAALIHLPLVDQEGSRFPWRVRGAIALGGRKTAGCRL